MKLALLAIFLALPLAGCKTVTYSLPAGAINSADAVIYRTLADAHGFTAKVRSEVAAGKAKLTPAQTKVFNKLIDDLNVADVLYQAYHAGGAAANAASLTPAVNAVSSDLSTAMSQIQAQ